MKVHEECNKCIYLHAFAVYMSGDADFTCRKGPWKVEPEKHQTPCPGFVAEEEVE